MKHDIPIICATTELLPTSDGYGYGTAGAPSSSIHVCRLLPQPFVFRSNIIHTQGFNILIFLIPVAVSASLSSCLFRTDESRPVGCFETVHTRVWDTHFLRWGLKTTAGPHIFTSRPAACLLAMIPLVKVSLGAPDLRLKL